MSKKKPLLKELGDFFVSCGEWFQTQMDKTFVPPTLSGIWSYLTGGFFSKKLDGKKFDGYTIFSPLKFLWNNAVEPVAEFVLSPFDKKATYKEEEVKAEVKNPPKDASTETKKSAKEETMERVAKTMAKRLMASGASAAIDSPTKKSGSGFVDLVGSADLKNLTSEEQRQKEEAAQEEKYQKRQNKIQRAVTERDENLSHAAKVRQESEENDANTTRNAGNTRTGI